MMKTIKMLLAVLCTVCYVGYVSAQTTKWREMHKVKKKETIFGIARKYGITVTELIKANPEMNQPGYELKKDDYIYIPYPSDHKENPQPQTPSTHVAAKAVNVGIVLPLHNVDGDGRRMVEYYRGMLLACEDMKKDGISVNIHAWNLPIDGNVSDVLAQPALAKCDLIFGPLYTKQVKALADFSRNNGCKLIIPFSINGNDVATNPSIYQVYQSPEYFYDRVAEEYASRFANCNTVVIDCNDRTSDKGVFTFGLRRRLQEKGISCNVTNLNSSEEAFAKAFSASKPNVVVLNTGRSPELNQAIAKLETLWTSRPSYAISLFGYTEWLMYVKYNKDKFFKFDTYIPTTAYYNQYSAKIKDLEGRYVKAFGSQMMDYLPRFAITGYDHAMQFLRTAYRKGRAMTTTETELSPLQTPLNFQRVAGGGYQNSSYMFVHYNHNHSISLINF